MTFLGSSCGKNPVGISTCSFSSGVYSTSSSSSTTSTSASTNSSGGEVSTQGNNSVDTKGGDTGVSGADISTGVTAAVLDTSSGQGISGSYSSMTFSINNNITHFYFPSVSGNPIIYWNASGVNQSYQKVRISINKTIPSKAYWEIKDIARSRGSIVYGDSQSATVVTAALPLDRGNYSIYISVYDNETNNNNTYGGGNFVVP